MLYGGVTGGKWKPVKDNHTDKGGKRQPGA